jgi:hypothetical protein
MASQTNYCRAQFDNQEFLSYTPKIAESMPPVGNCVTKVITAGPKFAPQTPAENDSCEEKGQWNINPNVEVRNWLLDQQNRKFSGGDLDTLLITLRKAQSAAIKTNTTISGELSDIKWAVTYTKGDPTLNVICAMKIELKHSCK